MIHANTGAGTVPLRFVRPVRILLLDDSLFDRRRIRRICAAMDFPVQLDEAGTLQAFKVQAQASIHDFYILDCRLPVGSGFAALAFLRDHGLAPASKVIMTSGFDAPEFAAAAQSVGCACFIEKNALTAERLNAFLAGAGAGPDRISEQDQASMPPTGKPRAAVSSGLRATAGGSYALGVHGTVVCLDAAGQVVRTGTGQDMVYLAMQMLEADVFIFRAS